MSVINHTLYQITFATGERIEHVDVFHLPFDEVIDSLLLLHSESRDAIKQVTVTYEV